MRACFFFLCHLNSHAMAGTITDDKGAPPVVVLAGGLNIEVTPSVAEDSVYLLSLDTMAVRAGPALPRPRYGGSALSFRYLRHSKYNIKQVKILGIFPRNSTLIVGGSDYDRDTRTVIPLYDMIWLDPETMEWVTLPQRLLYDRTSNPVIPIPEGYVQC